MLRTPVSCAVLLALVLLACVAPAASWAAAPGAATVGVADLTGSTATFQAKVNPGGEPSTAHFEYGTTDDLLLSTPDVAVGGGIDDVALTAPVTGLTPGRRYYMAAYVENASGGEYGDTIQFTPPRVPHIIQVPETDITQFSATLHVRVTSYGVPVTITATTVGPDGVPIPSGPVTATADGDATLPVAGLQPGTFYHWSATGTSAGGTDTTVGTFRTLPLVAMPRPAVTPNPAEYGTRVTVSGTVPNAPGIAVALQQQISPLVPFAPVAGQAGAADPLGGYRFAFQAFASATYGVSAVGYAAPSAANTVQLRIFAAVDVSTRRARRHRFVVSGRYWPDVPARAVLYRRGHGRSGAAVTPSSSGDESRTFRFPARKLKAGSYEVHLTMVGSTGVIGTTSGSFRIPRR
ncbi:MAG: hypothetical protein JWQ18_536 [Conexibacter sp.]|nr:hypothetical protein [Conexibacter sp.]